MGKRRETEHTLSAHNSSHLLYCYFLISKLQWNKITVHDNYKELFLHQSNSKINAKEPWYGGTLFLKKKGQRTFNNENVHRIKMLGLRLYPLYSPWLLEILHQRRKVIDSFAHFQKLRPKWDKMSHFSEFVWASKFCRTTWPETHRPCIIMRPRD